MDKSGNKWWNSFRDNMLYGKFHFKMDFKQYKPISIKIDTPTSKLKIKRLNSLKWII
jgi:hypothetical protein